MLGKALCRLRTMNGITAKDLSGKLGISPSYLSEIESDKKSPNTKLLNAYSVVFGIKQSTIIAFAEQLEEHGNTFMQEMIVGKLE